MKIIFDIGANKGQNLEYFLKKANLVIAVEANPELVKKIRFDFKKYIKSRKLVVENFALTDKGNIQKINFYISKINHVLSTLYPDDKKLFYKIKVNATKASLLIKKYLNKFKKAKIEYIKIDIEYSDHLILKDLLKNNIIADHLSVECHNPEILKLIHYSPYKSFKFVDGEKVKNMKNIKINTIYKKKKIISFREHSSGPFGDDIPGRYYNKNSIFSYFLNNGFGWKDIHCSKKDSENLKSENYRFNILKKRTRKRLIIFIPYFIEILIYKIYNKFFLLNKFFSKKYLNYFL